ncbi:MAG: hypothetical protein J3R72DRAFT_439966 [Linnemannia gamsii]|nr:MAG: hypothetical protein J3R72DRAFT_439966 [Linnemannia gamsii]
MPVSPVKIHTRPKCTNPKPGPGRGLPPATHIPPKAIPKPNRNPTTGKPGKPDRTRPQKGQPTIPRGNPTGPSLRDPKYPTPGSNPRDPPPPGGEQNPSTPPGGVPQDDPPAQKPDPDPTQTATKPTPTSPVKKPETPEEPELLDPPTEDPISRTSVSPSPTSTSTPTPSGAAWIGSSSESSSSSRDDGAMIGAIIGGLFVLLIVACFVSKWRKRRRRETGDLESHDHQPRPLLDKSAEDLDGATSAANEVDDDELMGPSAPTVNTLSGKSHARALPPPLDSPITPGAQLNYLTLFSPTASKDEVDDEKTGMLPLSASSRF